jgi:NADH-quinone oxidoreductase subunit C
MSDGSKPESPESPETPAPPSAPKFAEGGAAAPKVASPASTAAEAGVAAPKPAAPAAKAAAAAPKAEPKAPPPPPGPPDQAPPADLAVPAFVTLVQTRLPGAVEQLSYWVGDWTIIVPADRLVEVARLLRDAPEAAFDYCSDATATDWPTRAKRFDVIYCLYSTRLRHRVRVKARVADSDPVPSLTLVWPAANWLEREIFDMFGVNFTGHPDLRRMLLPQDWQGHPQRKDYPLEGPGEWMMESPQDWLKARQAGTESEIE